MHNSMLKVATFCSLVLSCHKCHKFTVGLAERENNKACCLESYWVNVQYQEDLPKLLDLPKRSDLPNRSDHPRKSDLLKRLDIQKGSEIPNWSDITKWSVSRRDWSSQRDRTSQWVWTSWRKEVGPADVVRCTVGNKKNEPTFDGKMFTFYSDSHE